MEIVWILNVCSMSMQKFCFSKKRGCICTRLRTHNYCPDVDAECQMKIYLAELMWRVCGFENSGIGMEG